MPFHVLIVAKTLVPLIKCKGNTIRAVFWSSKKSNQQCSMYGKLKDFHGWMTCNFMSFSTSK